MVFVHECRRWKEEMEPTAKSLNFPNATWRISRVDSLLGKHNDIN